MRRTVTISMSEDMYSIIRAGMNKRACSTVSEYIRLLVRGDRQPEPEQPKREPRPLRKANDAFAALDRDY